jgi:putative NADH-flavin reductase
MKVVVFGSTGGTGRHLVEQGLAQGHEVTAFARNPSSIMMRDEHLTVLQGDVLDPAKVDAALVGQDAVLAALGVGLRGGRRVLSEGTKNILATMKSRGVRRLVCETSYGVAESYKEASRMARFVYATLLKSVYDDKLIQEGYIRRSEINWIVVRPSTLTNGAKRGEYRVAEHMRLGLGDKISRADVADFMLKQLTSDAWLRKSPAISY